MLQTVQIAIMAKAPIPGLAKTRLIPALGAMGAARLQRRLTRMTVACALDAQLGAVTVWCAPDSRHRFFHALKQTSGVDLLVQPGGDLGASMHTAFRLHCVRGPLIVVGTDCPVLRPEHLREAAQALIAGDDAVFYPAEDGGYALVGLRAPQPTLFADMPWSTPRVMPETRVRAHAKGLRVREFETLWDVDHPAQLQRLEALLAKPTP
ncbi:MAG: TIGR04282 family arsenosugar biosynthesis glycosyltransferase [Rhizobiales bacterium]|nr:TIGR04282 family arsenosugar biosynthesis glycosyltransferase [Rhizobacter sp.]